MDNIASIVLGKCEPIYHCLKKKKKKVMDQQVIFSATSKRRDNWTNDRKVGFLPNCAFKISVNTY